MADLLEPKHSVSNSYSDSLYSTKVISEFGHWQSLLGMENRSSGMLNPLCCVPFLWGDYKGQSCGWLEDNSCGLSVACGSTNISSEHVLSCAAGAALHGLTVFFLCCRGDYDDLLRQPCTAP